MYQIVGFNFRILSKENKGKFKIKKGHVVPPSFFIYVLTLRQAQCDANYLPNSSFALSPTDTFIVSPPTKLPASNSCESGFIRYFCIVRFNGLAPKVTS